MSVSADSQVCWMHASGLLQQAKHAADAYIWKLAIGKYASCNRCFNIVENIDRHWCPDIVQKLIVVRFNTQTLTYNIIHKTLYCVQIIRTLPPALPPSLRLIFLRSHLIVSSFSLLKTFQIAYLLHTYTWSLSFFLSHSVCLSVCVSLSLALSYIYAPVVAWWLSDGVRCL